MLNIFFFYVRRIASKEKSQNWQSNKFLNDNECIITQRISACKTLFSAYRAFVKKKKIKISIHIFENIYASIKSEDGT